MDSHTYVHIHKLYLFSFCSHIERHIDENRLHTRLAAFEILSINSKKKKNRTNTE